MAVYPINTMIATRHRALGERTGFGIGENGDPAFTITKGHSHAVCVTGGVMTNQPANDNLPLAAQGAGNGQSLRFLSVCSGIEAASVAWPNWTAVGFAEVDKKASALLSYRYPGVPNYGDFTKIDVTTLGRVDILCGGTPCQAFSVAGSRGGLNDARGNLTLAFVELAHALVENNGLRNAVWENVPGVYSDKTNAFGCFLAGLVGADDALVPSAKPADGKSNRHWSWRKGGRYEVRDDDGNTTGEYVTVEPYHALKWPNAGMVAGPSGRAAWGILDAQHFGLAQRRKRVIVVADFGNGADPVEVLFERLGLPGYSPARREAGEGVAHATAPSLTASGRGVERTGDSRGQDPVVAVAYGGNRTSGPIDLAPALNAHGGPHGRLDFESEAFIAFTAKDYGADAGALSPTLRAGGHTGSHQNGGVGPAIAWSIMPQNSGKDYKARQVDVAQPLMAGGPVGGNQGGDLIQQAITVALRGREGGGTAELGGDIATALRASTGGGDKPHVLTSAVRRLTPRECERLQGFPDDYTRIPVRRYAKRRITKNWPEDMWELINGEWWLMTADGPRYKQLGNSWAVPKFRWLGERIAKCMPAAQPTRQSA